MKAFAAGVLSIASATVAFSDPPVTPPDAPKQEHCSPSQDAHNPCPPPQTQTCGRACIKLRLHKGAKPGSNHGKGMGHQH